MWAKKFTGVRCERGRQTQAGRKLRARTHARGAARAAATLDRGAVISIGSL